MIIEELKSAGLPPYKCVVTFKKKKDRERLPAFPCADCRAVSTWNSNTLATVHWFHNYYSYSGMKIMMKSKGQRLPADTESSTHVPLLHLVYGRLVSQTLHTNK